MLTKILFTLAVVVVVFALLRWRQNRELEQRQRPRVIDVTPEASSRIGWLATAVVVVLILATGVLLYQYWVDNNTVIQVRVVDAHSGQVTDYRAYRGDIDDREFVTVDGVRVVLAESDRLETSSTR